MVSSQNSHQLLLNTVCLCQNILGKKAASIEIIYAKYRNDFKLSVFLYRYIEMKMRSPGSILIVGMVEGGKEKKQQAFTKRQCLFIAPCLFCLLLERAHQCNINVIT